MANKEIEQLKKKLQKQGFDVRRSKGTNHYKVYKDGRLITTLPSTPSDYRSLRNARALLRRHGYQD